MNQDHYEEKLAELSSRIEVIEKNKVENTFSILISSGSYDQALTGITLAVTAANFGIKTNILFTFWGINVLKKKQRKISKKTFFKKILGMMQPKKMEKLPLSNLHMMGVGQALMKYMMKKEKMSSLPEMMAIAIESGVNLYACEVTCQLMGLAKNELLDECKIKGITSFLSEANKGKMFITI